MWISGLCVEDFKFFISYFSFSEFPEAENN